MKLLETTIVLSAILIGVALTMTNTFTGTTEMNRPVTATKVIGEPVEVVEVTCSDDGKTKTTTTTTTIVTDYNITFK